jgi:hypothetical protein
LLASLFALPLLVRWLRANWWRHAMLLVVLAGCVLAALSPRIFAGDALLVDLPLPAYLVHKLGMFRSSARFIWLPEYALLCAVLVVVLRYMERHGRPLALVAALLGLLVLQAVDTAPLRQSIAANVRAPYPLAFDPEPLNALVARADAIKVYPTHACVRNAIPKRYKRANMALMLAGATAEEPVPINSFYHGRPKVDCAAERRERATEALKPGILYVYLDGLGPAPAQIGAVVRARDCGSLGEARYCFIPGSGD